MSTPANTIKPHSPLPPNIPHRTMVGWMEKRPLKTTKLKRMLSGSQRRFCVVDHHQQTLAYYGDCELKSLKGTLDLVDARCGYFSRVLFMCVCVTCQLLMCVTTRVLCTRQVNARCAWLTKFFYITCDTIGRSTASRNVFSYARVRRATYLPAPPRWQPCCGKKLS